MAIHENAGDHCWGLTETLNRDCSCITMSREALRRALESDSALDGLYRLVSDERPHLFSQTAYFVSRRQIERMAEIVQAVEAVVALPAYQERVIEWAPESARFDPGPLGVFFGYDFHLQTPEPQLIEINTNAGGALLSTALVRALRDPGQVAGEVPVLPDMAAPVERRFVEMFRAEWRRQRGDAPLRSIAIVDLDPDRQYLSPEFRLFERLFQKNGIAAVVADPRALELRGGRVWHHDLEIDLVYNRLTDFSLSDPSSTVLREAYLDARVVLTPHPRAHALYADKRNLTLLADDAMLHSWGVPEAIRAVLRAGIPRTVLVTDENGQLLWTERRRMFFKPAAGYGGRGAYRGDKLTKRVWQEILTGGYIAQELALPSQRRLEVQGEQVLLKVDVRNYVYDRHVQFRSARMYQGQTTNFRTAGGGFAPVVMVDDARSGALRRAAATQDFLGANPFHFFVCNHPLIDH